mgnify:CR=1 FL=1
MNGFVLQNNKNIWYGSFTAFDALGFGNAFSCRLRGESALISGGLNFALHVGDEAGFVLKNRRAYAAALGLDAGKFTCCEQVHGSNVAVVDEALAGKGAEAYSDAVKNTDALVTNLPQLPLMLFFADCVPVIFADPVSGSIGLARNRCRYCRRYRSKNAGSIRNEAGKYSGRHWTQHWAMLL